MFFLPYYKIFQTPDKHRTGNTGKNIPKKYSHFVEILLFFPSLLKLWTDRKAGGRGAGWLECLRRSLQGTKKDPAAAENNKEGT
jgi:hypothetical protein